MPQRCMNYYLYTTKDWIIKRFPQSSLLLLSISWNLFQARCWPHWWTCCIIFHYHIRLKQCIHHNIDQKSSWGFSHKFYFQVSYSDNCKEDGNWSPQTSQLIYPEDIHHEKFQLSDRVYEVLDLEGCEYLVEPLFLYTKRFAVPSFLLLIF